ncbi:MAG: CRISPR system precrRNA processing endoribonuclease RAMP protein Cas6 [Pseudorhodoplanes sp.]|nr:MAG: CRISPR system precrRNA processing endoribonuclease RAMP protein Cas6 [Pseudorhodoplanes sp.]
MTSSLADRLLNPEHRLPLERLNEAWSAATIEAIIPGHAALAGDLVLMTRIRGALGRVLMQGASREALANKPCLWWPPCALDILFREQARIEGRHGIPKPWVLALDRHGFDLLVRITLFGFAMEWAGAVSLALATALQHKIDWRERARFHAIFLPEPVVSRVGIHAIERVPIPKRRNAVVLALLTPLDTAGDDPLDRPASVIGRIARRVSLLSRWMNVEIDADWRKLSDHWNDLEFNTGSFHRLPLLPRKSGRERQDFRLGLIDGSLGIAGDLASIWPILALGQLCHAGRGGTAGLGRYGLH